MFKLIFFILLSTFGVFAAQQVEVVSDKFEADEGKLVSKFIGNVKVTKGSDMIVSNELFIYFDKNKNPLKYEATGKAEFKITMKEKHYDGKAQKIIYEPVSKKYTFIGEAYLHEEEGNRKVFGEKIYIDESSGKYEVLSNDKKPVKFIFKIEDK